VIAHTLLFRRKEDTEVVGVYYSEEAVVEGATKFLKDMNIDKNEIADSLGPDWTWKEAIEKWEDLTDGYESFTTVTVSSS
jgi:hypothetical protein